MLRSGVLSHGMDVHITSLRNLPYKVLCSTHLHALVAICLAYLSQLKRLQQCAGANSTCQCCVPPLLLAHYAAFLPGAMATAYALTSSMTGEEAKQMLSSEFHIPTKVFFVVNHANYIHPTSPVVAVYPHTGLGDCMERLFKRAEVPSMLGQCREVFRLRGGTGCNKDRWWKTSTPLQQQHRQLAACPQC